MKIRKDYREIILKRQQMLQQEIVSKRMGAFMVTEIKNIRYLTGFTGSSALLIITSEECFFVTDFRYKEQADKEVRGCSVLVPRGSILKAAKVLLKKLNLKRIGFEKDAPYRIYEYLAKDFKVRAVDRLVEHLRLKKDTMELQAIKKAVKRAERAFLKVKGYIRPGQKELVIARRLERAIKGEGARTVPFDIIVASGENSAMPHARATERKLQPSDLVVIDWGAEAEGYFSDMTRTFIIKGPDIQKKKEIYRIVLEANTETIRQIRAGMKASEVDSIARQRIEDSGYGRYFGHATGHGVGLDIHELPRISLQDKTVIQDGMVFTVEPGIYITDLGGVRIEDMVYIINGRAEVLTSLSKKLQIL